MILRLSITHDQTQRDFKNYMHSCSVLVSGRGFPDALSHSETFFLSNVNQFLNVCKFQCCSRNLLFSSKKMKGDSSHIVFQSQCSFVQVYCKKVHVICLSDGMLTLFYSDDTAMMFGQHHFYTFDKRYFRFPVFKKRECQYLAARDFKDGNFTVTTDSESINVVTSDAQVKIYRSGVVKSIGISDEYDENVYENIVRYELPVKFKNTTIVRDGPYINLTNDFGFSLECDMEHFVCSYIVSGFYHNRTLGE